MSSLPFLSLFFHQKPSLARELLGSLFKNKTKNQKNYSSEADLDPPVPASGAVITDLVALRGSLHPHISQAISFFCQFLIQLKTYLDFYF